MHRRQEGQGRGEGAGEGEKVLQRARSGEMQAFLSFSSIFLSIQLQQSGRREGTLMVSLLSSGPSFRFFLSVRRPRTRAVEDVPGLLFLLSERDTTQSTLSPLFAGV